jgi:hypothetical protein
MRAKGRNNHSCQCSASKTIWKMRAVLDATAKTINDKECAE